MMLEILLQSGIIWGTFKAHNVQGVPQFTPDNSNEHVVRATRLGGLSGSFLSEKLGFLHLKKVRRPLLGFDVHPYCVVYP